MQYILSEEEHKQYMDNSKELLKLRVDNEKLSKENEKLKSLECNLKAIKEDLNKCIRVALEPRKHFSKSPDKIAKATIRKHFVTNLIIKHSDVKELYDTEQIANAISYE